MRSNFTFTVRKDVKNEQLKQLLIQCVDEEKSKFIKMADDFYNVDRRSDKNYLDLCNAIIDAADGVLNAGDWETSLFLRNTIKPLKKIREQALKLRQELDGDAQHQNLVTPQVGENCIKLYVSLYQANGHDMKRWADQLSSLSSYMTGRPVYQNKQDVIKAIRLKLAQTSEAYVVVSVDKSKIIDNDYGKPRKDRLDSTLMNLVPGAISSDNIIEFVHQNKNYYFYNQQFLLKTE